MMNAFEAPGRFWRGNLHGHSNLSDGALPPQEVCAAYRREGYDFVTISDHFREKYGYPVTDTRPFRDGDFTTLIGAELHAPQTSRGVEWHLLSVGLPLDFDPPAPDETGVMLARRAAGAGAFIAIAHPHWYQLTVQDAQSIDAAHAVEIYNHTSQVNTERGDGLVIYDALLSEGHRLHAIAVDDSHWHADDAFGGWVMVKAEENTPEALLAALKAGHFYSSQGPEIRSIAREGDELVIRCSPASTVIIVGPVSQNAREHGRDLTKVRLPLPKIAGEWCRAVVVGPDGRRAWSNPLWFQD